ncbi:hypothetical protein G8O24_04595 [Bradyrhizobium sp. INPA01-394B]|uniref:Uncharacterized protein n=1 Tax=Bradyrhizobium campsiandrae TaxID=1729892 RepID=A0ABR7U7C5_9BRAD|nr:hypothetical protein [Bradyrhizobium campsiandrae]MBC9876629.1 hypothetical protein [Bradyrhizobium campsiandrae]MBC9979885.1 hypothetical protein [Bradyrhizobium campsiandrae]
MSAHSRQTGVLRSASRLPPSAMNKAAMSALIAAWTERANSRSVARRASLRRIVDRRERLLP